MTAVLDGLLWSGETWQEGAGGERPGRIYRVRITDPDVDDARAAGLCRGVPRKGQAWPGRGDLVVEEVQVRRTAPLIYEVQVTGAKPDRAGQEVTPDQRTDPTQRPEEWTIDVVFVTEAIDRDADDRPLANSAGEAFDPPITEEIPELLLTCTRVEREFDAAAAEIYARATNKDRFCGFDPRTCRLRARGRQILEAGRAYWEIQYEIRVRGEGWRRRVLDQGLRVKTGTGDDGQAQYETVLDERGQPLSAPVLLNGKGGRLAEKAPPTWLEFKTLAELPFARWRLKRPAGLWTTGNAPA